MKLITTLTILIGISATAAIAIEPLEEVHAQSCASRDWGCEDGYCWKKCGNLGEWCWQAADAGQGSWVTCENDAACNINFIPSAGCGGACSC